MLNKWLVLSANVTKIIFASMIIFALIGFLLGHVELATLIIAMTTMTWAASQILVEGLNAILTIVVNKLHADIEKMNNEK